MNKVDNERIFRLKIGKILQQKSVSYTFIQDQNFNFKEKKIALISGFAGWSGGTFANSTIIIDRLVSNLSANQIPYYILDIDFVSNDIQLELFNSPKWGYFESCWIEKGTVTKRYKYKAELEPFLKHIEVKFEKHI